MAENNQEYAIETRSRSRSKTPMPTAISTRRETINVAETILEESVKVTRKSSLKSRTRSQLTDFSASTAITSTAKKSKGALEIFQNDKNQLLETSIEAIRTSGIDHTDNRAYKEYKEAGDYWNKTPKTDYTYSELSPHRREIAPNTVAMPNMSRNSLDKHTYRVSQMILQSPENEVFIRNRYLAASNGATRTHQSQHNFSQSHSQLRTTTSLTTRIRTFISSIFTKITLIHTLFSRDRGESLYITRDEEESSLGVWVKDTFLNAMKRFYLLSSALMTLDTYLLVKRSSEPKHKHKRRYLLLLAFLIPLLLLAGSTTDLRVPERLTSYATLPSLTPVSDFLGNLSFPVPLPSFSFKDVQLPKISVWNMFSSRPDSDLKRSGALSQEDIDNILKSVNAYTEKTISEKFRQLQDQTSENFVQKSQLSAIIAEVFRREIEPELRKSNEEQFRAILEKHLEGYFTEEWKEKHLFSQKSLTELIIAVLEVRLVEKGISRAEVEEYVGKIKLELEAIKSKLGDLEGHTEELEQLRRAMEGLKKEENNENVLRLISENSEKILAELTQSFATKLDLERHRESVDLDQELQRQKAFDSWSEKLVAEILVKLKSERVERTVEVSDETLIRKIVKELLDVYDADKTALPDFALETGGGQVISTRCTKTYQLSAAQVSLFGIPLWYQSNTPRIVLSPSVHPGQCWAFAGFPGYVVIQLSHVINVTGFTVEHIPRSLAPNGNIDSAPKSFVVMGLLDENDKEPAIFGTYEYSNIGEPLQYFPVQNTSITRPHNFVELRVDSNHGHPNYTCLYRFRVHGEISA